MGDSPKGASGNDGFKSGRKRRLRMTPVDFSSMVYFIFLFTKNDLSITFEASIKIQQIAFLVGK